MEAEEARFHKHGKRKQGGRKSNKLVINTGCPEYGKRKAQFTSFKPTYDRVPRNDSCGFDLTLFSIYLNHTVTDHTYEIGNFPFGSRMATVIDDRSWMNHRGVRTVKHLRKIHNLGVFHINWSQHPTQY